jgi:hypothetical protein
VASFCYYLEYCSSVICYYCYIDFGLLLEQPLYDNEVASFCYYLECYSSVIFCYYIDFGLLLEQPLYNSEVAFTCRP